MGMNMNYISEKAEIGNNVIIGKFSVIEEFVHIGDNCIIGNGVIIHQGSYLESNIRVDDNSVIGKLPMRSVNSIFKDDKILPPCSINEGCLIGAGVIIYAGCSIGSKTLIADLATIRENVTIGEKTIIGRGTAVENFCNVGSNCKLETNSYITAYSEIEDFVFVAPGVITSNDNYAARSQERYNHFKGVTIKKGGRIGAGAVILPGKIINEEGFVAAGSTVTRNVGRARIVMGNPAREVREVPDDQLLKNQ